MLDAALLGHAFVVRRPKTAVRRLIIARAQGVRVWGRWSAPPTTGPRAVIIYLIINHDLVFGFLHLEQFAKNVSFDCGGIDPRRPSSGQPAFARQLKQPAVDGFTPLTADYCR